MELSTLEDEEHGEIEFNARLQQQKELVAKQAAAAAMAAQAPVAMADESKQGGQGQVMQMQQAAAREQLLAPWGLSQKADAAEFNRVKAAMKRRPKVALLVGLSCTKRAKADTSAVNMTRAMALTVRYPNTQILTTDDSSATEQECWPGRHTTIPLGQGRADDIKAGVDRIQQRARSEAGIAESIQISAVYCEYALTMRPQRERECVEVAQIMLPTMLKNGMLHDDAFALFPHPAAPPAPAAAPEGSAASVLPPQLQFPHSGANALAAVFQAQANGKQELHRPSKKTMNESGVERVYPVFSSFFPTAHPLVLVSARMQRAISLCAVLSATPPSEENTAEGEADRRAHLKRVGGFSNAAELERLRPDAPFIRVTFKSGDGAKDESAASFKRVFVDDPAARLSSIYHRQCARLETPTVLAPADIARLVALCPRPSAAACAEARTVVEAAMGVEEQKRDYGTEALRSILINTEEPQLNVAPKQLALLSDAESERDFHNNWGSQFFEPVPHSAVVRAIQKLMHSSSQQMQTGRGSDHNTVANLLTDHLQYAVREYFGVKWTLATIATHSTDLIKQAFLAQYLITKPRSELEQKKRRVFETESDPLKAALLICMPTTYFAQAFVPASEAIRNGMLCRVIVPDNDPAVSIGVGEKLLKTEKHRELEIDTLEELQNCMLKHRVTAKGFLKGAGEQPLIMLIIEPKSIPGKGRTYSDWFLQELQRLCDLHKVAIVVDETLSWGRIEHPLVANGIPFFQPTMAFIGKSIGGALLLLNDRQLHKGVRLETESLTVGVQEEMENNYSFVASPETILHMMITLQMAKATQVHTRCKEKEPLWKEALQTVLADLDRIETRVRGVGQCMWACTARGHLLLPVMMVSGGRLLPKANSEPESMLRAVKLAPALFLEACSMGADAVNLFQIASCAFCGDMILEQNEPTVHTKRPQQPMGEEEDAASADAGAAAASAASAAATPTATAERPKIVESMACGNCPRQYHSHCQRAMKQHEKRFTDNFHAKLQKQQEQQQPNVEMESDSSASSRGSSPGRQVSEKEEVEDDFSELDVVLDHEDTPFSCICDCQLTERDVRDMWPVQQTHQQMWPPGLGVDADAPPAWADLETTEEEEKEKEMQASGEAAGASSSSKEEEEEEEEEEAVSAGKVLPRAMQWRVAASDSASDAQDEAYQPSQTSSRKRTAEAESGGAAKKLRTTEAGGATGTSPGPAK